MQHRDKRVADAIKDVVAEIVTNELSDPNIGFVTITRCHITRDLKEATVYFTVLGDDARRKLAMEHLEHAKGFVRHRLGQRIQLRYLPALSFRLDELLAQEMRVSELLAQIDRQNGPSSDS
jgi:ribosome-binding factor A